MSREKIHSVLAAAVLLLLAVAFFRAASAPPENPCERPRSMSRVWDCAKQKAGELDPRRGRQAPEPSESSRPPGIPL